MAHPTRVFYCLNLYGSIAVHMIEASPLRMLCPSPDGSFSMPPRGSGNARPSARPPR